MARQRDRDIPPGLSQVLLPGETLVTAVHAHWARVFEPFATTVAALAVTIVIDSNLTARTQAVGTVVWWAFMAVLARLLWRLAEWRHDWFAATDKRLLLRYGLLTHKVAMMPLMKVTDMSYERSIPGQFLGYGRFIMESAGQDQALRVVNWVPRPDETYRAICAEIFHIVPPAPEEPEDDDLGPAEPPSDPHPGYPDVHRTHNPVQDRLDSYSRAVPIQRPAGGSAVHASDTVRRRRGDDTGPITQRGDRRP